MRTTSIRSISVQKIVFASVCVCIAPARSTFLFYACHLMMLRFRIVCVIAATATVIASVLFISYSTSQPKSTHIILRKHQPKPFHMLSERKE